MDLNKVLLIGNLTRDPVLRYLNNGSPVCEFGLAVNRRFKRNDGEMAEEACFVEIVVWSRQGENCNQYLKKGSGAFIEGRLQFDQWQGQDGQKRSRLRVVAERVQFMPKGGVGRTGGGAGAGEVTDFGDSSGAPMPQEEFDSEVPF
ncbi:MAG: single-stranded DNA-binding protein [Planctomycetota bacterium]